MTLVSLFFVLPMLSSLSLLISLSLSLSLFPLLFFLFLNAVIVDLRRLSQGTMPLAITETKISLLPDGKENVLFFTITLIAYFSTHTLY